MGRLPINPATNFKGHVGVLSPPTDFNSIEAAVRGTLSNPPSSINDFDTLVALTNRVLLDEDATASNGTPILRGHTPSSYGHYQGFPKADYQPLVNIVYNDSPMLSVVVGGRINHFVGYNISLTVTVNVNNNITLQKQGTYTINQGQTEGNGLVFDWLQDFGTSVNVNVTISVSGLYLNGSSGQSQYVLNQTVNRQGNGSMTNTVHRLSSFSCGATILETFQTQPFTPINGNIAPAGIGEFTPYLHAPTNRLFTAQAQLVCPGGGIQCSEEEKFLAFIITGVTQC